MGIFGTSAGVLSDLSLLFEVVILAIITFSWLKVRKEDSNIHHNLTIIAVILNVIFVLSYMVRTIVEGSTEFQGPEGVRVGVYLPVVIVHGLVSTLVLFMSLVLIYISIKWGSKNEKWSFSQEKKSRHKKMGRIMFLLWYIAMITGIIVYVLLYVAYPQP
jgi:putative membrane protein